MKLLLGMGCGILAQLLTFVQLQGRFKFEWLRNHPVLMVLLGIPISYLFMLSVQYMVGYFDGQLWPSRIIGFSIGTIMFAAMSIYWFNEPINMKTGVCLLLACCILMIQLIWK